jgi:mannose-6-phosphate isomerase-like protein (cupin superfamily)
MGTRRIVTGHANGKAVFVSDTEVPSTTVSLLPGTEFCRLWGADQTCSFPDDGSRPSAPNYFPPVGGFRFGTFTVGPDSMTAPQSLDIAAAIAELNEKLPGLSEPLEPENPGMHTTATVDFEYIVSGRCVLELDDGATRELGPGDTVVQNGTRHAWRNPYDEPCVIVVALIGAHHRGVPRR